MPRSRVLFREQQCTRISKSFRRRPVIRHCVAGRAIKRNVLTCLIAQKPMKAVIVPGRGSELNHGGMTVYAGIELAVNELVSVAFTPPHCGESMTFQCVVRDRNGYTYGVEFIHDKSACDHVNRMQHILNGMEDLKSMRLGRLPMAGSIALSQSSQSGRQSYERRAENDPERRALGDHKEQKASNSD